MPYEMQCRKNMKCSAEKYKIQYRIIFFKYGAEKDEIWCRKRLNMVQKNTKCGEEKYDIWCRNIGNVLQK